MASVWETFGRRDDLPSCRGCDGSGAVFDRWSPQMWRTCQQCLGSGTPAARSCSGCGGTTTRHVYAGGAAGIPHWVTCTNCGGWGYLLGGYLHPKIEETKE